MKPLGPRHGPGHRHSMRGGAVLALAPGVLFLCIASMHRCVTMAAA